MHTYNHSKHQKKLLISFSSSLELIDKAVDDAILFLKEYYKNLDEYGLQLILHEGLTNAVQHGNKYKHELRTKLEIRINKDNLKITIRDEGEGFSPPKTPSKPDKSPSLKTTGRGIELIKAYSDKVKYNETGNEIQIDINITHH